MPSQSGITGTSYTVTGLTPGVQYDVRFRATNAAGTSGWSPNSRKTTRATADDALTTKVLDDLTLWTDWLGNNGAVGVLEEFGWPYAADATLWNALGDRYLGRLDAFNMPRIMWGASRSSGAYPLGTYVNATDSGDMNTARPNTVPLEAHNSATVLSGVSLSGAEWRADTNVDGVPDTLPGGGLFSNINPGAYGTDYFYPSAADWTFMAGRGVEIVRLMLRWERVQPTLGAALNSTEVTRITTSLNDANTAGIKVILGLWNQGGYFLGASTTSVSHEKISLDPSQPVTKAHFADFWSRMATQFGGHAALHAYSIMNEPATEAESPATTGSNLLANGTFDTDITGWTVEANCALARVTTPVRSGAGSLRMTATAAAEPSALYANIAATAGTTYLARCYWRTAVTARQVHLQVFWLDSAFNYLESSYGNFPVDNDAGWTLCSTQATAPANAAWAVVKPHGAGNWATNEIHYIDDVSLFVASGANTAQKVWEEASKDAVAAIVAADTNAAHEVWVAGFGGQHPRTFVTDHPVPWIVTGASRVRYAAHHYFDISNFSSGVYPNSYATELASVTP